MAKKIAVVTGAGSGMGRAAALALLRENYAVVLAGRRKEKLEETASLAQGAGTALAVPTDVADPASVDALFAATKSTFGRLDLLFNNAGVFFPSVAFEDLKIEQWNSLVAINFTGAFLCAQGAFRMMKGQDPQGGRIINNGSVSAHVPRPRSAPYTATKHAITGLTKSLSLDGRPYGIACGQIDIGNAATEMMAAVTRGVAQANGSVMAEPTMPVEEAARAVVYMASLPPGANVQFLTILPPTMPFIGRG